MMEGFLEELHKGINYPTFVVIDGVTRLYSPFCYGLGRRTRVHFEGLPLPEFIRLIVNFFHRRCFLMLLA